MVISVDKARTAIFQYMEQEIARKAVGVQKFMTYFVIGNLQARSEQFIGDILNSEFVKLLDVFDENGNIKIDSVYTAAKSAIEKSGNVTMYGITFNSADVDTLYRYMKS